MQTKIVLSLIFLSAACLTKISAQFNFQHLIGGPGNDRAQTIFSTFDNGYIVNGVSFSFGIGSVDATLIKTDNQGQTIWSYSYGTPVYDNCEYAFETSDHNILCSGRSNLQVGLPTAAIIFKTNPAGQIVWSKKYGGTGNDDFVQIIETADSGFAAIGFSESLSSGSSDILFVRTDINGDTIFTRAYGTIEDEDGTGIIQLPDGGFIITGRQITYPGGNQESDGLLLRTDASGNLLWTKMYGDSLSEELTAARLLPDGGFIITGTTSSFGAGNYDILLMKTDSAGNVQWSKTYGKDWTDAGYDIHINSDFSYIISGYTESLGYGHRLGNDSANIFLLKTSENGDLIWMETYGDGLQDEAFRSSKANDGGFLIGGFTTNYNLTDGEQMIFIKTDSLGTTGCHEKGVTPIDSVITMPFQSVSFNQLSGIPFDVFTMTQTTIIPPNNDACLFASVNSENTNEREYNVFPNPFNDILILECEKSGTALITFYDIFLRKIISKQFNKTTVIITENLLPGIYIYKIIDELGIIKYGKIIKK